MSRNDISPELMSLVKSFLKRKGKINWIDWLPLAEIGVNSPEQWIAAFNALDSTSTRDELLQLLGQPGSGPLADALLILLAQYALQINDEQIRDFVVEDVSQAIERTSDRVKALENECEPLKAQADWMADRLKQGFDLAAEIIRLESRLAELRAEEHSKAEEYDRIHALEREIIRLETFRRSFAGYDMAERNRYKEELEAETTDLRKRKETMQQVIAEKLEQRDRLRRDVAELQVECDGLQLECDNGASRLSELSKAIEQRKGALESASSEKERLRVEHAGLLGEIDTLEQSNRDMGKKIAESRLLLDDLGIEAAQSGFVQIEAKIREVYALLPPDQADGACG